MTPLAEIEANIVRDLWEGQVREIAADESSTWAHTVPFDVKEIQSAVGGEKPMFAEVVVLHEGYSKKSDGSKNIGYSRKTVDDLAKMLPGTQAYLGHQREEDAEYEYRHPVGKYVASRVEERDIKDVGRVACAVAKLYVSAAAKDFRTHLHEGLAGPVSLSGTALFKALNGQRTNETIGMRRLKSVDFCNPGTSGVSGAGVTGLVQEIASATAPGAPAMADNVLPRLTRADLLREFPEIIRSIVADETSTYEKTVKEITARAEGAESKATILTGEKTALETKVTDLTKAHTEATKRAETAEGKVSEMTAAVRLAGVKDAFVKTVDERIKKAKDEKNVAEASVLEIARGRLVLGKDVLKDNDDEKQTLSLVAAGAKFDTTVAEVREMAKAFGAPQVRSVGDLGGGTTHKPEEGYKATDLFASSKARAAREKKAAEGKTAA